MPRLATDPYTRRKETAEAGYYSVTLEPAGIQAELTSTPRVGAHRYHFPIGSDANILIDLGAIIQVDYFPPANGPEWGYAIGGVVEWLSASEISPRADLRGGWAINSRIQSMCMLCLIFLSNSESSLVMLELFTAKWRWAKL